MKYWLLLLAFGLHFIAYSQSYTLEGKVVGKESLAPLPYTTVEVLSGINLVANIEGDFSCELNGSGPWNVKFSNLGYFTDTITLDQSQLGRKIIIQLAEKLFNLEGVVIEGKSLTKGHIESYKIPGSYHYVSPENMNKTNRQDIHQVIKSIPGVYFQEEDGYGLRPNIGMRGSGSERSSKITIMEDGILMAPAPYSAPAAYYFPHSGRIYGVEVLKGSNQIRTGPFTTSGSINLLSTPMPDELSGQFKIGLGSFNDRTIHSHIGAKFGQFRVFAETFIHESDGFKKIPNYDQDLGFKLSDYIIKAQWQSKSTKRFTQSLEVKIGQSKEDALETYLGVSRKDFQVDPYQRYAAGQRDQIISNQNQYSLTHFIKINRHWEITTTAYRNAFQRNWYKLDAFSIGDESWKISKITDITPENESEKETEMISFLKGYTINPDHNLFIKANNREYLSQGVQSIHSIELNINQIRWHLDAGIRYHYDQQDRFQWKDSYYWNEGSLALKQKGVPGTESNRINKANAFAGFIQNNLEYKGWLFTPGLRIESIQHERKDYGKEDPDRRGLNIKERRNPSKVMIPGVGISKQIKPGQIIFAGIHKGFTPAGDVPGTLPEVSWNSELGVRILDNKLQTKSTLFLNNYQRLLGSDLTAVGGTGSGDLYNGGSAIAYGVELEANYVFKIRNNIYFPLSLQYTYNFAKFSESFESAFGPWADVEKGDQLPYLPKSVLAGSIGFDKDQFSARITHHFQSELLTKSGQNNAADIIPARWLFDIHFDYRINRHLAAFSHIQNLFDQKYLTALRPAGLRPGMPRSVNFGIQFHW